MEKDRDIFKIQSNKVLPARGKILISEPFLADTTFNRSVVLLVDHSEEGSMGIILNKRLPIMVNEVVKEFKYLNDIPLCKGGPVGTDTLFYLHRLDDVRGAYPIGNGMFLNGDFNAIKRYVLQGNPVEGNIRFFLGYSGWDNAQLKHEIDEDTWLVGASDAESLMTVPVNEMWRHSLGSLGGKYETWSHFPRIPSLN